VTSAALPVVNPSEPLRGAALRGAHPVAWLLEDWQALMEELDQPPFRAQQIFRWVQLRGVLDPQAMTNLDLGLRARLGELDWSAPARVESVKQASDGTQKLLLALPAGGRVECVLIPMTRATEDADAAAAEDDPEGAQPVGERSGAERVTLCVSTQYGCAMGCTFCASGQAGLLRGLGAAEVVWQVQLAKQALLPGHELRNLVFMGMGEPLHRYDETARALRLLTHPDGLSISPRRITVSTVGLVPGIRRLGEDFGGKVGLAVSLHAPENATRDRIVPINRRYPLEQLIAALENYPLPRRRRITIEYTLIAGVNDRRDQAQALARLLQPLRVKVNLIPMNPISGSSLSAPPEAQVEAFRAELARARVSCSVRRRRGDDVAAACGQLALEPSI
jgi:23S rRNA (adenine2503-C2)-methyltransferase